MISLRCGVMLARDRAERQFEKGSIMLWEMVWEVCHKEAIGIVIGAVVAFGTTGLARWWKYRREMREIRCGQQFQQLEFAYAFVTKGQDGMRRLIVRTIGSLPLKVFVA